MKSDNQPRIETHEHDFVPPANDDEQQCDADCRANWHRCSICKKSRSELAKEPRIGEFYEKK